MRVEYHEQQPPIFAFEQARVIENRSFANGCVGIGSEAAASQTPEETCADFKYRSKVVQPQMNNTPSLRHFNAARDVFVCSSFEEVHLSCRVHLSDARDPDLWKGNIMLMERDRFHLKIIDARGSRMYGYVYFDRWLCSAHPFFQY